MANLYNRMNFYKSKLIPLFIDGMNTYKVGRWFDTIGRNKNQFPQL